MILYFVGNTLSYGVTPTYNLENCLSDRLLVFDQLSATAKNVKNVKKNVILYVVGNTLSNIQLLYGVTPMYNLENCPRTISRASNFKLWGLLGGLGRLARQCIVLFAIL